MQDEEKNSRMKKYSLLIAFVLFTFLVFGQSESESTDSSFKILDSLIGGFIGGILGVIGTILSSYYGPRKLEKWRMEQKEKKHDQPRKKLLKEMLDDNRFPNGRRLSTLSRVSGTNLDECRRLLIDLDARGITLKDDNDNEIEGWVLIANRPLNEE